MHKRLNISLPEKTVRLIDRIAPKGERSQFVDQAVQFYIRSGGRAALRKKLAEGYKKQAEESLAMAADWFPLEEEAWQQSNKR